MGPRGRVFEPYCPFRFVGGGLHLPDRVALTDGIREVVAHAADRTGAGHICANGRGHWTPIAAATPIADQQRDPCWSSALGTESS